MNNTFGLYVILTNPLIGYEKSTEAALKAGVKYIQLRIKNRPFKEVLATAKAMKRLIAGTGSLFIVNDDVTIAAEADADGVHLGQEDMSVKEARAFWKEPGRIYGLSTHNEVQAEHALTIQQDYIGVGPVFKTPAKAKPDPVLGIKRMGEIIGKTPLPAVAIGGISLENVRDVLNAGAVNFSAVRAIMQAEDPFTVIRKFQAVWEEFYCNQQ